MKIKMALALFFVAVTPIAAQSECQCFTMYTYTHGGGGISSVGLTAPSWLTVAGSPLTEDGTLAVTAATGQTSGRVIGTCGSATSFGPCALVAGDIPALSYASQAHASTHYSGGSDPLSGALGTLTQLTVDNIDFNGNTISTTNANGAINFVPDGTGNVLFPVGSETFPSMAFTGDSNTGFFDRNSDRITASLGGISEYEFQGGYFALNANNGLCWTTGGEVDTNGCGTSIGESAAGVIAVNKTSLGDRGGWVQWAGECYVAADATNATATMASTGCSISVTAGRKYGFKCVLMQSDSVAAEGAKIDFAGGTAGETNFRAQVTAFDTALNLSTQVDDLADAASAGTFTGNGSFEIHGAFEPSSTGTFIPRFAQASHVTGTLTLFRGSHCLMWDMP